MAGAARGVTNAHGYVSLAVGAADSVAVRSVGFEVHREAIADLRAQARTGPVVIRLTPVALSAGAAEVTAVRASAEVLGVQTIPVETMERLPAGLGEVDVVRVFQLLPGVRGGTEGTAGLFVRGGSPDQTLTRLDGATVYNASHVFGFFSVFNPAAVKRVDLVKGSLPARYGGRLGSVLDVQMREGDAGGLSGEASLGLVSSHGALDGPLQLGTRRGTFAVSARRSYIDLILRPFQPADVNGGYAFWDANAKAALALGPRDRLLAGVYTGRDALVGRSNFSGGRSTEQLGWGNATATLRWTRRVSERVFSETTLLASTYRLTTRNRYDAASGETSRLDYRSDLTDIGGSARLEISGERVQTTRLGAEITHHGYRPGATSTSGRDADGTEAPGALDASDPRQTTEGAAYAEADARLGALLVNAGARISGLASGGRAFGGIEPRASVQVLVAPRLSASASVAVATQYVHLLTNSGSACRPTCGCPSHRSSGPSEARRRRPGWPSMPDADGASRPRSTAAGCAACSTTATARAFSTRRSRTGKRRS